MTEQELKFKIATEIARRQLTKQGINDATDAIYKILKEQLTIHSVVVPKGTLCECGKEYTDKDKEHGMCHKCWSEIKE